MKLKLSNTLIRTVRPLLWTGVLFFGVSMLNGQDDEAPALLSQGTADIVWLALCASLVFFMQAGFAMVETGMTRAKNACNIMMKNLLDFSFGALGYYLIGYGLMYGESNGFIGWSSEYFMMSSITNGADGTSSIGWFFQVVFCATAATIVGGAMAERTKFAGYIAYAILVSVLIYPITGHWIWGGGWLSEMNIRDFAGSTVVHSVGGWCALAGAIVVGARTGKYGAKGQVNVIPGHNLPLSTLGVFILWFGWYGFNAGSTLGATDGLAHVAVTTTLAAAAGVCAATCVTWIRFKKPDLTMSLNGALAGLVSITAPCACVSMGASILIGAIGGVIVVYTAIFFERTLKIDDPVGAISVHGVCGVWGTLAVGLFGQRAIDILYWDADTAIKDGLFYGGGFSQFGVQLLGVVSAFVYAFGAAFIIFYLIKKTIGLRVSPQEEQEGLDIGEHGHEAYADFTQYAD